METLEGTERLFCEEVVGIKGPLTGRDNSGPVLFERPLKTISLNPVAETKTKPTTSTTYEGMVWVTSMGMGPVVTGGYRTGVSLEHLM